MAQTEKIIKEAEGTLLRTGQPGGRARGLARAEGRNHSIGHLKLPSSVFLQCLGKQAPLALLSAALRQNEKVGQRWCKPSVLVLGGRGTWSSEYKASLGYRVSVQDSQ